MLSVVCARFVPPSVVCDRLITNGKDQASLTYREENGNTFPLEGNRNLLQKEQLTMKYVVNLEGHDGLFSCKTEFKCGDEFFARGVSNSGCSINPFRYLSPS